MKFPVFNKYNYKNSKLIKENILLRIKIKLDNIAEIWPIFLSIKKRLVKKKMYY